MQEKDLTAPSRKRADTHQRGADKVSRIPVKVKKTETLLRKPDWIRAKAPTGQGTARIKEILRDRKPGCSPWSDAKI